MDPVIVASARKHGVHDDDILHAYRHPTRVLALDDLVMLIGASRTGQLLEIGEPRRRNRLHHSRHAREGEVHQVTTMPRSIQDILDHADELAKRYEDFDPDHAKEIPVEEYLLQRAVVARARSEQQLVDTVISARGAGLSWQKIGAVLGTSAQAAQQRYGTVVEAS